MGSWDQYGEYFNPRQEEDHDRIGRIEGRLSVIERFTGADGVNGMAQQFRDLKKDMDDQFEKVYSKLEAMEEKREEAAKWRIGTLIAAVASLSTLLTVILMFFGE